MIDDVIDLECKLGLDNSSFKTAVNDAQRIASGFTRSLTSAFVGVAVKGKSLGEVVDSIGLRLSRLALNMALQPIETGIFENILNPLQKGIAGIFAPGKATPGPPLKLLAKGGVIASPTFFPMSGGLGLAGERGAEAVMPLARGPDGSLGVRMQGQGGASITINIATPDVDGFRRSQSEIAASLARMVSRGRRGL